VDGLSKAGPFSRLGESLSFLCASSSSSSSCAIVGPRRKRMRLAIRNATAKNIQRRVFLLLRDSALPSRLGRRRMRHPTTTLGACRCVATQFWCLSTSSFGVLLERTALTLNARCGTASVNAKPHQSATVTVTTERDDATGHRLSGGVAGGKKSDALEIPRERGTLRASALGSCADPRKIRRGKKINRSAN
jgi:hypothetical protein